MDRRVRFQSKRLLPKFTLTFPSTNHPQAAYGQGMRVGDDTDDPDSWPRYIVAHMAYLKQEPDPDQPGKNRIPYEFFLAQEADWSRFGEPYDFERFRNGTSLTPFDN